MLGDGEDEYISSLKNLSIKLNIEKNIEFKGFVSEEDKIEILQKSHALINTSYKEGWGLVNLEANSQGTPAIVFDVEGCKDSVKDGINGYISNTEKSFIENIEKVMKKDLSKSSLEYSKKFNYDIKSEDFWKIVSS
jgi:glycosyltransferase involved in cell wall biosynthesis